MQIATLSSVKMHWREDGDPGGRAVVFANSLGSDLRLWDAVVARLPENLRLIRFDKRGHGLSSCPDGPYTISGLANDAAGLLDMLDVKGCTFVGLSIGGMIAQQLAAKRPDQVSALVLSNTGSKIGEPAMWKDRIGAIESGGVEALADGILERWFAPPMHEKPEMEAWRNMLTRTPLNGYIGCCHAIANADLTDQTATITQPTLVIGGSEDGSTPPEMVQATAELIQGARCEIIDNTGHLPCAEDPDRFAELLIDFLKETADV